MKRKIIDPFTGLELEEIDAAPPMGPNPLFDQQNAPTPAPLKPEQLSMTESTVDSAALPESSFFDKLLFGLTGAPDADLPADKLAARNSRRSQAGNAAADYNNPGERYMQPVSGGGGSGLESIGQIVKLLGGIGG